MNIIRKTQLSFTLIELIVTLSIIGLLMVTIIPSLGKYSRSNNVGLAGQTIREALADVRTYATSPDPSVCPLLPNKTLPSTITTYAFYADPSGNARVPKNTYPLFLPAPSTPYVEEYACGQYSEAQVPTLTSNQFAILAIHTYINPADSTQLHASVLGIVSVGALDKPAIFTDAINNNDTISAPATLPIFLTYSSPSGTFAAPIAINGLSNACKTVGVGCNTLVKTGNKLMFGSNNSYQVRLEANDLYAVVSVGYDNTYRSTVLINLVTGQVSSTKKPPAGIN